MNKVWKRKKRYLRFLRWVSYIFTFRAKVVKRRGYPHCLKCGIRFDFIDALDNSLRLNTHKYLGHKILDFEPLCRWCSFENGLTDLEPFYEKPKLDYGHRCCFTGEHVNFYWDLSEARIYPWWKKLWFKYFSLK